MYNCPIDIDDDDMDILITGGYQRENNIKLDLSSAVDRALEGLTTTTSECSDDIKGSICMSDSMLNILQSYVVDVSPNRMTTGSNELIKTVADNLKCTSESCILSHPRLHKYANDNGVASSKKFKNELNLRFKARGPRDSHALLSNFNIDDTLQRWGRTFNTFYPCPFAMMDFDYNEDRFGSIDMSSILKGTSVFLGASVGNISRKFNCFGCVVNTDISSGPGKHWVAVFVDCRATDIWTVEYFNSAGHPPPKPIVLWMEKVRVNLSKYCLNNNNSVKVVSVAVTNIDHQESMTECGIYALYYIRRRLEGISINFFEEGRIPDQAVSIFRQHVFRHT